MKREHQDSYSPHPLCLDIIKKSICNASPGKLRIYIPIELIRPQVNLLRVLPHMIVVLDPKGLSSCKSTQHDSFTDVKVLPVDS